MMRQAGGDPSLPDLMAAVLRGEQASWDVLVRRFTPLLWSVCRGYRLGQADAADVVQVTWLRLAENLDRIQDHDRIAGWLATTCRRECQAVLRRSRRVEPIGEDAYLERLAGTQVGDAPDARLLRADRDAQLWNAFARLSERCQRVLRVLVAGTGDGPIPYREAADLLDMPVGALGPTRGRCLAQLRALLDEAA